MDTQKLELLEARVHKAIEEIDRLRSENSRLKDMAEEMRVITEEKDHKITALEQDSEKVKELSLRSEQLMKERDTVRLKIESFLDKLEKIDII